FANAFVYFIQLSWLLRGWPHRLAFYAIALAAFFAIITVVLRWDGDNALAAAHLAIAIGFITIAIPLQFDRFVITIGWIAEAAVLLAMRRVNRDVFRVLGAIALTMAVFRLLFIDKFHPEIPLWNLRALLFAMTIAVFARIALGTERKELWRFAVFALNFL